MPQDPLHDVCYRGPPLPPHGENDSRFSSVASEGSDDVPQSSPPVCPAFPERPPSPMDIPSARDSGYAWVVMWVVFCVNILAAGYIKSFGIMYLLLLQYFPGASGAQAGWTIGLLLGTRSILAPVVGALTVKLGARRCCFIGTALITLGLLLSIPTFSIYYMAATLGGLVGFGISLSETPGYLLVNDYFLERRLTANGFRAAGNPLGGIVFPPLLVFLNEQFGLKGTFIMLAGIMLHLAVLGTLMRPFEQHQRMVHLQLSETTQVGSRSTTAAHVSVAGNAHEHHRERKALEFTLLKDPRYLTYLALAVTVTMALSNFIVLLPAYADSLGINVYRTSLITSYVSGIDFVFRMLCGYITDKLNLNGSHVFAAGLLAGGAGCLLVPLCFTTWQLILASTLFSLGAAIFWALLNSLLADEFGAELTASTWGFFRMVQGTVNLTYPSLLGVIRDVSGGYVVPFLVMGSCSVAGFGVFLLQPLAAKLSIMKN